jgi:hypothetical protein
MSDYMTREPMVWPNRPRDWKARKHASRKGDSWRMKAYAAIVAALKVGRAAGLTGRALELHVSRTGYPFGTRRNYPYEVWLDCFRRLLRGYQGPASRKARKPRVPGQLELFDRPRQPDKEAPREQTS